MAGTAALVIGALKALATDGMTSAFWFAVAAGGGAFLVMAVA
ncbi:hypothetical protein PV379_05025 [Streptomyces caniscabiei]|nr:hypothetical protein [Streptomyces caniscabiei]MDX2776693.1 hypothetical protein [Streptomyces caniscabiei]